MFNPNFTITPKIVKGLMHIEAVKQAITDLPITPTVLAGLRKTARLQSIHYSTMIEGNRLTQEEVRKVIEHRQHFPDRKRDEKEVLGYYSALDYLEKLLMEKEVITEKQIQTIHAFVMSGGKTRVKPSAYRNGQNVIRDSHTGKIVYMPPEAKDVIRLMNDLVSWINSAETEELPCPIISSIAHYQFATIHPYYDGNGRTSRLLTTLILHKGGYDLKGLYSLEEYYAENLQQYYEAIAIGPSHNYYLGRAEADITGWIEYFCEGMELSFEAVKYQAENAGKTGEPDKSTYLRRLDLRQRKALELFLNKEYIISQNIAEMFNLQPRTARNLCQKWVKEKFIIIADPAKKSRKYSLSPELSRIFSKIHHLVR